MRRTLVVVMALAALAVGSSVASAQSKSFAGSWTLVPDPAAAAPAGGPTMSMWMDEMGMLAVETTSPGRGGGAPTTPKMTYKKG